MRHHVVKRSYSCSDGLTPSRTLDLKEDYLIMNTQNIVKSLCIVATLAVAIPASANEIYAYIPTLKQTVQVTNFLPISEAGGKDTYNPTISPYGFQVVAETWSTNYTNADCEITNILTHVTTPLAGTLGCNNAAWSPNGKFIAYDNSNANYPVSNTNIYIIPAGGGTPILVRAAAYDARWSPDSSMLVFEDLSSMYLTSGISVLKTINLATKTETTISAGQPYDYQNPAWSPNGKFITYNRGVYDPTLGYVANDDVYIVPVDRNGNVTGPATQMTFGGEGSNIYNQNPSFSPDSRSIAFQSNGYGTSPVTDYNFFIYLISLADRSAPVPKLLTGLPGGANYNPAFSSDLPFLVYSGQDP